MTDSGELAEELRTAIGALVRTARNGQLMPPGELALLGHLDREGPLTTAELAGRRQIRHQSAAKAVKELLAAGLVEPGRHATDGRKVPLHLTAAGRELLDTERRRRADRLAAAIEELSPGERAEVARLTALLTRLTTHIRGER
ncbi:MarR family winged helix-turn-helix transcriptional regulator [Crossiella cryophila]|uniref:DNA-binding MarR family transcriptional regulator n=1 Tax=Crossiella cryophila TaxID=43355 RepID=A0A7W7FUH5_9PSEU|nr:MarR family winged helix-turn-helix transcriptional regulator [Crossiella cryophila]MBB4677468.1 DNA-binding MarR family transcriptional regulator [Crossiella cryophila]